MCINPENELLQQCIASGQVDASQVAQHAAAGEYSSAPKQSGVIMSVDIEELKRKAEAATPGPWRLSAGGGEALPKLVLALPDYEKCRIVVASDEMIDGERVVCIAIDHARAAIASSTQADGAIDFVAVADAERLRIAEKYEQCIKDGTCEVGGHVNRQWAHLEGAVAVVQALRRAALRAQGGELCSRG